MACLYFVEILSSNEKYIGQTDIAAEDSMCVLLKETKTCFTV